MRFQCILVMLLVLALCAESVPKKGGKGKKLKNAKKKVTKKGPRRPAPPRPTPPRPAPPRPAPPQPAPPPRPPFRGCISQESENLNWLLKEHIEAEMKVRPNNTGTFKALKMCWLAEMAKVAFKYRGLFPGIEALHYAFISRGPGIPDSVQLFTNFIERYGRKLTEFPPVVAGNQTSVLPFGCNWGYVEVHCVFVTGSFFDFVLQLAQLGNRSLKEPSDIFSSELLKLMESAE